MSIRSKLIVSKSEIDSIRHCEVMEPMPGAVEVPVQSFVLCHELSDFSFPAGLPFLVFFQFCSDVGLPLALLQYQVFFVSEVHFCPFQFLNKVVVVIVGCEQLLFHDGDVVFQLCEVLGQDGELVGQSALIIL